LRRNKLLYNDPMKPALSKPRRFLELRQRLTFASDEAKDRIIERIKASGPEGLELGALMVGLDLDARVLFPKHSAIPILFKDIDTIEMGELDTLVGKAKVALEVTTDDALWAMNYETQEPERVGDHSHTMPNTL